MLSHLKTSISEAAEFCIECWTLVFQWVSLFVCGQVKTANEGCKSSGRETIVCNNSKTSSGRVLQASSPAKASATEQLIQQNKSKSIKMKPWTLISKSWTKKVLQNSSVNVREHLEWYVSNEVITLYIDKYLVFPVLKISDCILLSFGATWGDTVRNGFTR